MGLRSLVPATLLVALVAALPRQHCSARDVSDESLAGALASEVTRQYAVDQVAASGGKQLPLLLSWAKNPPAGIDADNLDAGLADVFGRLRTKEAIPFLISHITVLRSPNTTMKGLFISIERADQAERNRPAIAALIRIGRDALPLLYRAYYGRTTFAERCAFLLAIYRINDPDSLEFFMRVRPMLEDERGFVAEALKTADKSK